MFSEFALLQREGLTIEGSIEKKIKCEKRASLSFAKNAVNGQHFLMQMRERKSKEKKV